LRIPTIGGSRERQIDKALETFYQGFVAEEIDKFYRTEVLDTTGRRQRGLLTGEDMARWQVPVEDPLTYDYHGYTVCKPQSWSQGPVFLQQLALLKNFDLGSMEPNGPDFIHTVVECAKLALADREKFYGDPAFVDVPFDTLLSGDYNDERRKLVGVRAMWEISADRYFLRPSMMWISVSTPRRTRAIPAIWTRSTGTAIWLPQHQAAAGFALRPACPISVFRSGQGARCSGSWRAWKIIPMPWHQASVRALRQDQWGLNFFLRRVHFGMNLQQAIDYPNFSTKHAPSSFYPRLSQPGNLTIESRMPDATIKELEKRGHDVKVTGPWTQSRGVAAGIDQDEGVLLGAASPRSIQSYAFGW
jgi:gamma-glutamyltranspeptidase/glutathione hydrolase